MRVAANNLDLRGNDAENRKRCGGKMAHGSQVESQDQRNRRREMRMRTSRGQCRCAGAHMHMLETENEPHISWSPSRKRLAHNYTSKWLGACLRFNPNKDRLEPQYQKDKEISDINALLAPLRTCHNFIAHAWPDKTSTRRHLHLALESGCISCTRQGSCKEGGTGVDFSTCCL